MSALSTSTLSQDLYDVIARVSFYRGGWRAGRSLDDAVHLESWGA